MAIFKAPRTTTAQRMGLVLEESEIVFDVDEKVFYGGNGVSPGGFLVGSGVGENVETFVLSGADLSNKFVTLLKEPSFPNSVTLIPDGGIPQRNGVDFDIIGDQVSWDGKGLDGNFLEENDILIIQY